MGLVYWQEARGKGLRFIVPPDKSPQTGIARSEALKAQKKQIEAYCTISKSQDMYNVAQATDPNYWTKRLFNRVAVSVAHYPGVGAQPNAGSSIPGSHNNWGRGPGEDSFSDL